MGGRYIALPKDNAPKFHKAFIIIFISIFTDPGIILGFLVLG